MSSHDKHMTASVQSFSSPLLLCVPIEIDILGHSCDVVMHGNLLKIASIHRPLSVLIFRDAKSLRILLVKLLRNVRLRSRISLERSQKKTVLQPDAEVDNVPGVTRTCAISQCCHG